MLALFVYGTLKPGETHYDCYCAGRTKAEIPAYAWGELYDLPLGYPAMTVGRQKVWGILLKFNDPEILYSLDRLAEYEPGREMAENEYDRRAIAIDHPSGGS
ncbi:MAG: gamma-glutamylcyclotransferase [Spirulina sp.]